MAFGSVNVPGMHAKQHSSSGSDPIAPDDIGAAPAKHTHNYAGASSAGGAANSAAKLATARNIDGMAFAGSASIRHYIICSTAGDTAQKDVNLTGLSLVTSAELTVRFTYANTAENPTLNVNGVAAAIRAYGSTAAGPGAWQAGEAVRFVFATASGAAGGGYWYIVGGSAVPNSRTVNEKALSEDITLKAADVGALAADGTAAAAKKLATARTIDGVSFNGSAAISHYGTCSTAGATAAKVVSLTGFSLVTGALVAIKFIHANSAKNPTLNVNGTGAKAITRYGTVALSYRVWEDNAVVEFRYDGTSWVMVNGSNAAGRPVAGEPVEPAQGETVEAGICAEIFNDYRPRTFNADGVPQAGNVASGGYAHAEGQGTTASGTAAHAEGRNTQAIGDYSHAEGQDTVARGTWSHASGCGTVAEYYGQFVTGKYNKYKGITADIGVGMGSSEATRANSFRVTSSGIYASGDYNSSGADYAELFEWADGNPDRSDRAGRFVTLDGEKIRLAGPADDYILGIVSGNPSVVGDVYDDQWQGMFLSDIFGRSLFEDVEIPAELGPEGEVIIPAHTERRRKLNPAYNHEETYLPRSQRPEWDAIGMLGKLVAVDDGTCQVNGWCQVGEDGIATASAERTKYRVMARLDEDHIRVMIL